MAYNTGEFSLFKQSATISSIVANLTAPRFAPRGSIGTLAASLVNPTITITGAASAQNIYAEQAFITLSVANSTTLNAISVNISGPSLFSGNITNAYSLLVTPGGGAGTIQNNYTAYFDPFVGFGTTTPMSALDVAGAVAVGTYAGAVTAPNNSMVISGMLGVASPTSSYAVDVMGQAGATHIYSPQTTQVSQLFQVDCGWNQAFGGSAAVGSQLTMNTNAMSFFNMKVVNTNATEYSAAVFDGRYLYMVPMAGQNIVARFDTTLAFGVSQSYSFYDVSALNSLSNSFNGGAFDGTYVYYVPFTGGAAGTSSGQITRYNTTSAFSSSFSYNFFNTASLQSNSVGFSGAVFDGRYIYFVPNRGLRTTSGQVTRFDTISSFTSSSSYRFFDMATVQSNSTGFAGGIFDGRYIYYAPSSNRTGTYFGQITSFDTRLPFTSASSYSFFNTTTLQSNSKGFSSQVTDGRYLYFMNINGQITRYDTTLPFTNSLSYSFFNTTTLQSNSTGFSLGAVFDGRHVYFIPSFNFTTSLWHGQITRYDVTQLFSSSVAYSFFNVASVQSLNVGFGSASYDGRYVYCIPFFNGVSYSGQIVRLNAYGGTNLQALNAWGAPNGLTMLGGGALSLSDVVTVGTASAGAGASTSRVQGYLVLNINGVQRKIPFYAN